MLLVKDTDTRFGLISVLLHWYIAATILFLLSSGETIHYLGAHGPLRPFRESLAWWHMSFAITGAPFIFYRIYWRLHHGKPKTYKQHWTLKLTADTVWRLLLIAMVCQVITGPSRQLTRPEALQWFGITVIPVQPWLGGDYTEILRRMHFYGAAIIGSLLLLHIGGALKHFMVNRDRVLQGMLWPFAPKAEAASGAAEEPVTVPVPAE